MELRALVLLLLLLLLPTQAPAQGSPRAPEARDRLCGRHLLRALVRVCGGPRWSRETSDPATGSDREHLRQLPWPAAGGDTALVADRQPLSPKATNLVYHCCLTGCTHEDLLSLCPH
ncbi:insulin-like 3 [Heterocephalus glaber]|uniref:Insulin-like 3 n=1 Tax=Heterocephalus glaber TaxID=10181 RepID=A0AAX6QG43_HETGA|nr:insulin-like 3 [Heterocephalus glaber]